MKKVEVSLKDDAIYMHFDYDPDLVFRTKRIPGARFVGPSKPNGPGWKFTLEMETCRAIRKEFGDDAIFTEELVNWGRQEFHSISTAVAATKSADAELVRLPEVLPDLYNTLRPYQRAGVRFIGLKDSRPLIADEPGLGKTRQVIGGIYEGGIEIGGKLVIAPKTALESVWLAQLQELQHQPVFIAPEGRDLREWWLEDLAVMEENGWDYWAIVNPQMVQLRRDRSQVDPDTGEALLVPAFPELMNIDWSAVICDEVDRAAMQNPTSQTAKALYKIKSSKRIAMSGTPVRGRPIKLWGILHWLHPEVFTSKWRWAYQWLAVEENRFGKKAGKVMKHREEEFNNHLAPYMLRRTKKEVLPELPDKTYEEIWVRMEGRQAKQYKAMAEDAEMRIDEAGTSIAATSILAEYTRLKQFANAFCVVNGKRMDGTWDIKPSFESAKLPALVEILQELGIMDGKSDDVIDNKEATEDEEREQVVIFSQFTQTVDMVCEYLKTQGVDTLKITGAVGVKDRFEAQKEFQGREGARVIVMNTMAGGVAITLDMANTVIFLDETWTPDDQLQAEDRVHRISRIHKVRIIYIRSKGSIEEDIMALGVDKSEVNSKILDLHRAGFRAVNNLQEDAA